MHLIGGMNKFVQLRSSIRHISFWSVFGFNWVDLTLDYEIVLHLLLPEVEVQSVELP